jgi:hypothetical protein
MPYIAQHRRHNAAATPESAGELNYALTCVIKEYMEHMGLAYQTINDIVGALEGAKMEFYRRIAVPYEDIKIKENGDVYG